MIFDSILHCYYFGTQVIQQVLLSLLVFLLILPVVLHFVHVCCWGLVAIFMKNLTFSFQGDRVGARQIAQTDNYYLNKEKYTFKYCWHIYYICTENASTFPFQCTLVFQHIFFVKIVSDSFEEYLKNYIKFHRYHNYYLHSRVPHPRSFLQSRLRKFTRKFGRFHAHTSLLRLAAKNYLFQPLNTRWNVKATSHTAKAKVLWKFFKVSPRHTKWNLEKFCVCWMNVLE